MPTFHNRWKCEIPKRNLGKVLTTYSNSYLVLSVLHTWHPAFASYNLCVLHPIYLIPSLGFCRLTGKKKPPLAFPRFISLHPFPSSPQSLEHPHLHVLTLLLSISSTPQTLCLTGTPSLQCPLCITTPSHRNGFPMLRPSHLPRAHVSSLGIITL